MNFKQATDRLFIQIDHQRLAASLGVSVASIRQARLAPQAQAHRGAPKNWQRAVLQLAEEQVREYQRLIEELVSEASDPKKQKNKRSLAGRPITEIGRELRGKKNG